jgi:hypothetical protein
MIRCNIYSKGFGIILRANNVFFYVPCRMEIKAQIKGWELSLKTLDCNFQIRMITVVKFEFSSIDFVTWY